MWSWTKAIHNKSSLLLKIPLHNTQTLKLFIIDIKHKLFTKVIKNAKQQCLGFEIISSINWTAVTAH